MGNKLESVRNNLEQAKDRHADSLEMAREDAEEMKEIRSIISEIPRDIDSDLLEQIETVSDASTQEGTDHMESEVHGVLDEGTDIASDVQEEGDEQSELSEQAAGSFESVSDTRFGGSGAEGAERAHETADNFREASADAKESVEQAQRQYEELLSEVQG